jgi:hypothetical protein
MRGRGLRVQDIYLRLIPYLIGRGDAQALPKEGKLERWAFRPEATAKTKRQTKNEEQR